jgi:hypothetical protein
MAAFKSSLPPYIYQREIFTSPAGVSLTAVVYEEDLARRSGTEIADDPIAFADINKMFDTLFTKNNAGKHVLSTCADKMLDGYQETELFEPENANDRVNIDTRLEEEKAKLQALNPSATPEEIEVEAKKKVRARRFIGKNDYLMLLKLSLPGGAGSEPIEYILGFMLFSLDSNYYSFVTETNNLSPIDQANLFPFAPSKDPASAPVEEGSTAEASPPPNFEKGVIMALYMTYVCSFSTIPEVRTALRGVLQGTSTGNVGTLLWNELRNYTTYKSQSIKEAIYQKHRNAAVTSMEEFYAKYPFYFFIYNMSLKSAFMYHYNNGMRIIYSELIRFFYYIAKFNQTITSNNGRSNNGRSNNGRNNNANSNVSSVTTNGNRPKKSLIDHLHRINIYSIAPNIQVGCVERYIDYLIGKRENMREFSISAYALPNVPRIRKPKYPNNGGTDWQEYHSYKEHKNYKKCNKRKSNNNNNNNNNSNNNSSNGGNVYNYGYGHIDEERIKKFKSFTSIEDYLFLYYLQSP